MNGNLNPEGSDNTADIPSKLTVAGGYIEALEFGAAVAGRGAQLDISDGVIVAENNAAVAGNGTNSQNAYYGGTKLIFPAEQSSVILHQMDTLHAVFITHKEVN